MASVFLWPPSLQSSSNVVSPYGYLLGSSSVGSQWPYDANINAYRGISMDYYASSSIDEYACAVSPVTPSMTTGFEWTTSASTTFTLSTGQVAYGKGRYQNWLGSTVSPDFGTGSEATGEMTNYATSGQMAVVRSQLLPGPCGYTPTNGLVLGSSPYKVPAKTVRGSASTLFMFYMSQVQTGTVMGSAVFTNAIYCIPLSTAGVFGTPVLMTAETTPAINAGFDVVDAGEGFYYLIYTRADNSVVVRSVNCTGAAPVVSAILSGSGTVVSGAAATYINNQRQRYVTIGSNRMYAGQYGNLLVKVVYTTATRTTPTIAVLVKPYTNLGTDTMIGTVLEYDPTDPTEAYLVVWTWKMVASVATFNASYMKTVNTSGSYSAVAAVTSMSSPGDVARTSAAMSACLGESVRTVVLAGVSVTFGNGYTIGFSVQMWHTPITSTQGVIADPAGTYSGMDVGYTRTVSKGVTSDTGYSSVVVGSAVSGSLTATFRWSLSPVTSQSRTWLSDTGYSSVAIDVTTYQPYKLLGATFDSTYSGVTAGNGIIATGVLIDGSYASVSVVPAMDVNKMTAELPCWSTSVGTSWMEEFMGYVNADRAALGLAPYPIWGSDNKYTNRIDVASMHSADMSAARIMEHESSLFPVGQQTLADRGGITVATSFAENLEFVPYAEADSQNSYYKQPIGATVNAHDVWLNWHNSPGHYANIVRDWESSGIPVSEVYSQIGAEVGLYDFGPGYGWYLGVYLTHNFLRYQDISMESPLDQYWQNTGAMISQQDQQWSNAAYTNVKAELQTVHSLRVSAEHTPVWGARVAAEVELPIHYGVSATHTVPYAPTVRVSAQQDSKYDLQQYTPVANDCKFPYSGTVQQQVASSWSLTVKVAAQQQAAYDLRQYAQVSQQHTVQYSASVHAETQSPWSLQGRVAAALTAPYIGTSRILQQHEAGYDLTNTNPVSRLHTAYHALLQNESAQVYDIEVLLISPAGTLRIDDGILDTSTSDTGFRFECSITDMDYFARLKLKDPVTVSYDGEEYSLFVDGKSVDRSQPAEIKLRINCLSPSALLFAPYAKDFAYTQPAAMLASDIVNEIVGALPVEYDAVDWIIPRGRFQVEHAWRGDALQTIANASGAVIGATRDGKVRVYYAYPKGLDTMTLADAEHMFTDIEDNLSASSVPEVRDGQNAFRLMEGDSTTGDIIEWVVDDDLVGNLVTGEVRGFLSPWRDYALINHVGGADSAIPAPEGIIELTEIIEFRDGSATVGKPIHELVSLEWITPALGAPAFEPYSTALTVGKGVNEGTGAARITYKARHLTVRVASVALPTAVGTDTPPVDNYAQFVIEEN